MFYYLNVVFIANNLGTVSFRINLTIFFHMETDAESWLHRQSY